MKESNPTRELKRLSYEIFILLLTVLSLINIVLILLLGLEPMVEGVLFLMNGFITLIFMLDFLYRLFSADSKRDYFVYQHGWADLLAAFPYSLTKIFRLFRVVRVVRLMGEMGKGEVLQELRYDRSGSSLFMTVFMVFMVIEFGGGGIVYFEANTPGANIKTASDGVWWTFVTITTVGYGDHYPVSSVGRIVGMITMTIGVGLYGVLTGFLANTFIAPKRRRSAQAQVDPQSKVGEIHEFRRLLEEQERVNAALKGRLAEIEAALVRNTG